MFRGASPIVFQHAKALRKAMTPAELVLWGHLKLGIDGYKFRTQRPIGSYIADMYCHKLKLVIELDGSIHKLPETILSDRQSECDLKELDCTILRFSNEDVLSNLEIVLDKIAALVAAHSKQKNQN